MDNIKEISISKIADILSKSNIIVPQIDIWKKIFYNAGQSDLYNMNRTKLQCREVWGSYGEEFKNDSKCYEALHDIFIELIDKFDEFKILINCILNEANMYIVFKESCKKGLSYLYRNDLYEGLKHNTHIENNELLYTYQSDDFKILRDNINILGLEISFDSACAYKLIVVPYEYTKKNQEKSLISQWLEESYPEILKSYVDAIKAYSNGDSVGTLTHCRNVITGIFTYNKSDRTKWYTGLQKACINDKNINMISTPASIASWTNNNVHDEKIEKRYNYPRFKTIVQIYSFLSDLGPHINEAPLKDGEPDYESTNSADALFGLRITEDILIWLYNNK